MGSNNEDLYKGDLAFISFIVDRFCSHVRIEIGVPDDRRGFEGEFVDKVTICWPFTSFNTHPELIGVLQSINGDEYHTSQLEKGRDCYSLSLHCSKDLYTVTNLLVDNPPAHVATLSTYFKNMGDTGLIKCHVCGFGEAGAIANGVKALEESFRADSRRHPLTQWNHPDKTAFIIQHNEFIPPESRPQPVYRVPAKSSFISIQEYMVMQTLNDLEEAEYARDSMDMYEEDEHSLFLMSIPGGEDRVYLGLIPIDTATYPRLSLDDQIKIMDAEDEDTNNALHATVTDDIPGVPLTFLTVYVNMNWSPDSQTFNHGPLGFEQDDVIPLQESRFLTREVIARATPMSVKLKISQSNRPYRHRVAGLASLHAQLAQGDHQSHLKQALLGNDISSIPKFDIFAPITGGVNTEDWVASLNEDQAKAFHLGRAAPAGFVLIMGPPGTGKTYVALAMIMPFILARDPNIQILCCSTSNASVDSMADEVHNIMTNKIQFHGQYMVRVFSIETEMAIAKQAAMSGRIPPPDMRPELVQALGQEEAETYHSMTLAGTVHKTYLDQKEEHLPFIGDKRVTTETLTMSVGYRIRQLLNCDEVENELHAIAPTDEYHQAQLRALKENFSQFSQNVKFDSKRMTDFRAQLSWAREYVISRATVVSTTPALAIEAKVYTACQDRVRLLVFDEGARVSEPESVALFAFYPHAIGKVLIGDTAQNGPLALAPSTEVYFQSQYTYVLMERLIDCGMPYVLLRRQYRMCLDIAGPINTLAYRGRLITDDSTSYENRPMAKAVRAFNKIRFNRERVLVYLNVRFQSGEGKNSKITDGTQKLLTTGSRFNTTYIMIGINLAKDLVDAHPTASIAILTAYSAQVRFYYHALVNLIRAEGEKYSRVTIETFDGSQGKEYDITITDILILGKSPGHQAQRSRMNVAFSRSKVGLYIIANKEAINQASCRTLSTLQTEWLTRGAEHKLQGPFQSPYFTAEDVDLLTARSSMDTLNGNGGLGNPENPNNSAAPTANGGWGNHDDTVVPTANGGWDNHDDTVVPTTIGGWDDPENPDNSTTSTSNDAEGTGHDTHDEGQ